MDNNKKIVIVDDEQMILKSLKRELEPWAESYNVEIKTFVSANEALVYLSQYNKDVFLIISDLRMPEIKGSKFLLQANKIYPQIKLFLLTAYSDMSDIQEAITASIDRLIIKPWDNISLQTDIENAFKQYKIEEENYLLKQEIQQNLVTAGEFQQSFLSDPIKSSDKVKIDIKYEPLKQLKCGGDFYDFLDINESKKLIMLGDVSGHGIKPAFVTAMLKVLCSIQKQTLYNSPINPEEIITVINNGLFKSLGDTKDIIVTFTIAYIDQLKKKLKISGAGQLPVYILREDELISIKSDNVVMGFIHDAKYNVIEENLKPNDLIIMFTDGLIESEKSKMIIDKDRIKSLLLTLDLSSTPADKIYNCFKTLQQDREFADDVTLITTKIL